jgi:hypothetical protein
VLSSGTRRIPFSQRCTDATYFIFHMPPSVVVPKSSI